jgi:hypothetical protein
MAYTTINKGSSYFNGATYLGSASAVTVSSLNFQPDFVWIKDRQNGNNHCLVDSVRGVGKYLSSNLTAIEINNSTQSISSFTSTGFVTGTANPANEAASNTIGFMSWNWLGSNTTTSNTAGSVTSTVSANTTSGFSIVKWTTSGSSGNNTIGHGLGVAPKMIIMKAINITYQWDVFNASIMPTGAGRMILNSTAAYSASFNPFGAVAPTSTVFSNDLSFYGNGHDIIAYCFADVKGYSKFGSYTGNGNANGTFIYTGFKPAFILIKRSDSTGDWYLQDNVRNQNFNGDPKTLQPNTISTESSIGTWNIDNLSNGFKIRESNAAVNASGGTYIYMAFAQNPFVSSTQIPTTAR